MTKRLNIINEFIDSGEIKAETKFARYLGDDNHWFFTLLYELKEEWMDKNIKITDLNIRENFPVFVSLIKTNIPYKNKNNKGLVVERERIVRLVERFTARSEESLFGDTINFSFSVMGLGSFRINCSEDSGGIGLAIRYLTKDVPDFRMVQYPEFYIKEIESMITRVPAKTPYGDFNGGAISEGGLILHCGATGTGKSTAQASEIAYFAQNTTSNIITYEKPIETKYIATLASVRQFEIDRDIAAPTKDELREKIIEHAMRLNPSLIQFQEAADKNDIRMVMDISLKGHLVISTIHASNIKEALTTLMAQVKEEEHILASCLKAIVAHKLHVNEKGEIVPVFEILIPTKQDRALLHQGKINEVIKSMEGTHGKHKSAMSFRQHVNTLVANNKLTPREANFLAPTSSEGH